LAATIDDPTYGRMEIYRLGSQRAEEPRTPTFDPSSSAARDST
jgi:hypothetical protein